MAVCYAIIFMHIFECSALEATSLKPFVWCRFIDNIFAVWTHGEDKLLFFVDFLNSINPNIKFTLSYSPISVNFLDVEVILSETGEISTDLFVKPTDTHQFLLSSSCHPERVKSGIAFSQALRVVRAGGYTPDLGCSSVSGDNESTNSTWKWLFFCFLLIV